MVDNEYVDIYDILTLSAINKVSRAAFNSYYNWRNWQFKLIVLKECRRLEGDKKNGYNLTETEKKYLQLGLAWDITKTEDFSNRYFDFALYMSRGPKKSAFRDALNIAIQYDLIISWVPAFLDQCYLPNDLNDLQFALNILSECPNNTAYLTIARKLISINSSESLELLKSITPLLDDEALLVIDCAFALVEGTSIASLLRQKPRFGDHFYSKLVCWRISCSDSKALEESLEIASLINDVDTGVYYDTLYRIYNSSHVNTKEAKLRIGAYVSAKNSYGFFKRFEKGAQPAANEYTPLEGILFFILEKSSNDSKTQIFQIIDNLSPEFKSNFFLWMLLKHVGNIDKISSYDLRLLSCEYKNILRKPILLTAVDKASFSIDVPEGSTFAATVHGQLTNQTHTCTNDDIYNVLLSNYEHIMRDHDS